MHTVLEGRLVATLGVGRAHGRRGRVVRRAAVLSVAVIAAVAATFYMLTASVTVRFTSAMIGQALRDAGIIARPQPTALAGPQPAEIRIAARISDVELEPNQQARGQMINR